MIINNTINKKFLESFIYEAFSNKSTYAIQYLLDALKNLGFYYATNSGVSVSIEDLKTPISKDITLCEFNKEISSINARWEQGLITDTERFQAIIENWTLLTETLKERIVNSYCKFDPLNNLYVMAFSGARGNISQVGQLIGIRGLMADQTGQIIDLPIQSNFREGLTSIDYLVSSFGARKGLVDTALKTADAGYLTRRLIYLTQDLVVKLRDCKTHRGISVFVSSSNDLKPLFGRTVISLTKNNRSEEYLPFILSPNLEAKFGNKFPFHLKVRCPLTCESNGSVCQMCYGWDLAEQLTVSLGEAIGIIAAQSIGEPGTQLTMRTFHTGGVFAGEKLDYVLAPFSGWCEIPKSIHESSFRTSSGNKALKLKEKAFIRFISWNLKFVELELAEGSLLHLDKSSFVKKNQIIGEHKSAALNLGKKRLVPIRAYYTGELKYENENCSIENFQETISINKKEKAIWIASGEFFSFPYQGFYTFPKFFQQLKAFGLLKFVTPFAGYIEFKKEKLSLCSYNKKIEINFNDLEYSLAGCKIKIAFLVKNLQYVDEQVEFALIHIFPKSEDKIFMCKKKNEIAPNLLSKFFYIGNSNIWKICLDQIRNSKLPKKKEKIVRPCNFFYKNIQSGNAGFHLKNNGSEMIFQSAYPIFLGNGAKLNCTENAFILRNQIVAFQTRNTLRTEDIIQGIPKISSLIESRRNKEGAFIANKTGLIYESTYYQKESPINIKYSYRAYKIKYFVQKNLDDLKNFEQETNYMQLAKKNLSFAIAGESLIGNETDSHQLLKILYKAEQSSFQQINNIKSKNRAYIHKLKNYPEQIRRALLKFRILLANSILGVYYSQGVSISSKHVELVALQLTSKSIVKNDYLTSFYNPIFYNDELIDINLLTEIYKAYIESENLHDRLFPPMYVPKYNSATQLSFLKDGFLAPAAFQETKKTLTKAAILGKYDWLRNLKENVISDRALPSGTTYFNWTNKLNAIYFFKNETKKT